MDEEQQSLIDRMAARLSPASAKPVVVRPRPAIDLRFGIALAASIALGPLSTIVAATLLAQDAWRDAARLQAVAAPRTAAVEADRAARTLLADAVAQPGVSTWIDRAAQALPDDARVSRIARKAGGTYELDVVAPDPDLVRQVLRRTPAFAGFREIGQQRAGAMILIRYRRTA